MSNQSPWTNRRQGSLSKTKSFENELKVPTMLEAQVMMSALPKTRSSSVEALNQNRVTPEPSEADRKIRARSPFKFFMSKKDEGQGNKQKQKQKTAGRAAETGLEGLMPPAISISNASFRGVSSPYQQMHSLSPLECTGSSRRPTLPQNLGSRRGSRAKIETEVLPDESSDMLDTCVLDLVDEYFYGVRIFPGQDPSHVFCGWVTASFKHYDKTFDASNVRKATLQVWAEDGHLSDFFDRHSCYILNAGKLYSEVHEDEALQGSRSNQGINFFNFTFDLILKLLSFMSFRFNLKISIKFSNFFTKYFSPL